MIYNPSPEVPVNNTSDFSDSAKIKIFIFIERGYDL